MRYFIVVLFALIVINVNGSNIEFTVNTGSIKGQVVEKGSKQSIPFASVKVVEKEGGVVADEDGNFILSNLAVGKHTLQIHALGFKTSKQVVEVVGQTASEHIFSLDEDAFLVDEVVVSANRNEVSRKNAPVVVNVMSTKLFETVNSTDLAKSLNYQSGLRVENNCQNCGFPQVRINGLEGPYSQILINSRPIISALSGVYGLEHIPVNMIERVEVVRGGGSALFGANAVGGTINIITKDPVSNSFQVASTISSMNGKSWEQYVGANASLVSKDNKYGIALYQTYRNRNPYDADGDGFSELGKLNMNTFGLRGYYRPTKMSKINLEYHTTNEFRRGGNKFDLQPHETDITEEAKHIINSGGASYDLFWSEYDHKLSVYGSLQHTDRKSYYGAEQDPNAYGKTDDLTWVVGGMYSGKFKQILFAPATLTGGIEYQDNKLDDEMLGYNRVLSQKVHIGGSFLQNEWEWNKFNVLLGGRLDKHNLISGVIFSPRINILYKPIDDLQARLTYSTGFRAPQAYDEDLHVAAVGGEGVQIKLADNLREERSTSFSGSIDWNKSVGLWQLNLLVEGFYTELRHVFILEDITNSEGLIYKERRNGNGARVYGANLDAKLAYINLVQLQLGFTAQRSKYKKEEIWATVENEKLTLRDMSRTPNYYGYFTLTSSPIKRFDISITGLYTGKMRVPHMEGYIETPVLERTPHFIELGSKLSYTFALGKEINLQLNGGIQNMFNSFQKDLDKGALRDSNYFYGPTQPRTYFMGIKISH